MQNSPNQAKKSNQRSGDELTAREAEQSPFDGSVLESKNMSKYYRYGLIFALLIVAAPSMAVTAQIYCNDLYPPDSYDDPQERNQYLQECLESYIDDSAESSSPEEPYYEGTVEDYVEDIPVDE